MRKCSKCDRVHYAKGYCTKHYQRLRSLGSVEDCDLKIRPRGALKIRDSDGNKQCSRCLRWLPEDKFASHGTTSDKKQNRCYACTRLDNYGITLSQAKQLLIRQAYRCAICENDISVKYCIDHDHSCCPGTNSCGQCVRGFLCDNCNHGLGNFLDDPKIIRKAIIYLQRYTKGAGNE